MLEEKTTNIPPWVPSNNLVEIARIGKAQEELSELGKILARIQIQGRDAADPKTGELNMDGLRDEIADVHAQLHLLTEFYNLDTRYIDARIARKVPMLELWFRKLDDL